jgi:CAAX protease family protein
VSELDPMNQPLEAPARDVHDPARAMSSNEFAIGPGEELHVDGPSLPQPRGIAPVWHTLVLIAAILVLSLTGSKRLAGGSHVPVRLATYGMTIAMQLVMLGWVWLGLKLRKVPFRSLYGVARKGAKMLLIDLGIALAFWCVSLFVLGALNLTWLSVDAAVHHRPLPLHGGKSSEVAPEQRQQIRTISQLAPEGSLEFAGWFLLCAVVGVVEETVFRGYLQSQFTAWGGGKAAYGVVFSALLFGAAHGYEGIRSMALLAVYGVLFSLLVLLRRSLRANIVAHAWHDFFTGLMLAFLRSHRML